jgi:capsular exopolysaccharide synthesis family protein
MRDSKPTKRDSDGMRRVKFSGEAAEDRDKHREGKVTAGVPLAKIIRPRLVNAAELVVQGRSSSAAAGRIRQLRARLDDLRPEAPQTIVITSAGPAEGKSFVAINLALAFAAESDGDVLLLDADLRRPSVGRWITPAPKVGLAELLPGRTGLAHALLELGNWPLHVLPAGEPPGDPLDLLVADAFEQLMVRLKQSYRRIVIDTPAIVPFTDADLVARFSDGVLVVARLGLTRRGPLMQAISSVTSAPVLGALLNDIASDRND